MFSGAAPLPSHVEEFLRVTCCSTLAQGYGNTSLLTEFCGFWFISMICLDLVMFLELAHIHRQFNLINSNNFNFEKLVNLTFFTNINPTFERLLRKYR